MLPPNSDVFDCILDATVENLMSHYINAAKGNRNTAERAIIALIRFHNPETAAEVELAGRIVHFNAAATHDLRRAMQPGLSDAKILRYRASARGSQRSAEANRLLLLAMQEARHEYQQYTAQKRRTAPEPPRTQLEATIQAQRPAQPHASAEATHTQPSASTPKEATPPTQSPINPETQPHPNLDAQAPRQSRPQPDRDASVHANPHSLPDRRSEPQAQAPAKPHAPPASHAHSQRQDHGYGHGGGHPEANASPRPQVHPGSIVSSQFQAQPGPQSRGEIPAGGQSRDHQVHTAGAVPHALRPGSLSATPPGHTPVAPDALTEAILRAALQPQSRHPRAA